VDRFTVDGKVTIYKGDDWYSEVILDDFTGEATHAFMAGPDDAGSTTWKAVLDATPVGGGTPAQDDDQASIKICETPVVDGIPDDIYPFEPFDLDEYLTYSGSLEVAWSYSTLPEGWTVVIDSENMVTVTAPLGADPATITFTASVECCDDVFCSDSDDATFTPNRPPDCTDAAPSIDKIWPPNHKFVPVTVLGVTDPDGDPISINIDSIRQDEPVDTHGDGSFTPDGQGVGTDTAEVRAERSGTKKVPGDGRVYHISFTADDGRGGVCSGKVLVGVPHDVKDTPVDGGALYDSTALSP
jgi:hypothetical protein